MSIEQAIIKLAEAIENQTSVISAALAANGTKVDAPVAPAEPAKPAKKAAAAEEAKPAKKEAEKPAAKAKAEVPYTDVQLAVADLANAKGKQAVLDVLAGFDVDHAKKLTPDQYADAIAKLKAAASDEGEDDLA